MSSHNSDNAIAVIGMACRLPGARDPETFWHNLRDGVESISHFDEEELLAAGVEQELLDLPVFVRAKPVLEGIDRFDASFFGINPREAELMDPQHRIFLEVAWESLERAGYDPAKTDASIGVFAGATGASYLVQNLSRSGRALRLENLTHLRVGNGCDFLTTQVSYRLDLTGPSMTVQTACSTSLTAIAQACQSLLDYQCDMALAGGICITIPEKTGYLQDGSGMVSPDGHIRAFDAEAAGAVFGDGAGIVVLKRLDEALADRDHVHACILGSAVNNDGACKIGFTTPSVTGQARAVEMAFAAANVEPESIGLMEAHGAGTKIGDSMEVEALTRAFRKGTDKVGFCALGSVKTNVGHLVSAAGVTAFIKTALALEHQTLPPSLNFENPNPEIDLEHSPFYVPTRARDWPGGDVPRRASVNSAAFGGTNVHVVLEESPPQQACDPGRDWKLVTLSARSESALDRATENLALHLKAHPEIAVEDVAFTQWIGRVWHPCRRAVVCRERGELVEALSDSAGTLKGGAFAGPERPVAFLLSGVGDLAPDSTLDLYLGERVFREEFDRCCEILRPLLGLDLRELLVPGRSCRTQSTDTPAEKIDLRKLLKRGAETESQDESEEMRELLRTVNAQPSCFVIDYALARLWMSWGVEPEVLVGHSIGEYVAACLAGVFSLEDALMLVASRAQMIEELPEGALLGVMLPEADLLPMLDGDLELSSVNAPKFCVVGGPPQAISAFEEQLDSVDALHSRVAARHAFHTQMVASISAPFEGLVRGVKRNPPRIPYLSNRTGTWATAAEATDPNSWARHTCETLRFADDLAVLAQRPELILLEIGPGQTLSSFAMQTPAPTEGPERVVLASMPHPLQRRSSQGFALETLAKLWLSGARIESRGLYCGEQRRRIPLPSYPFESERYWIEPDSNSAQVSLATFVAERDPLKKADPEDWFYTPTWSQRALMPPAKPVHGSPSGASWLLFADEQGVADALADLLRDRGENVCRVGVGSSFSRKPGMRFEIDPGDEHHYRKLLRELEEAGMRPTAIAHLWTVDPLRKEREGVGDFDSAQTLGFYSLINLVKALAGEAIFDALEVVVVSTELQQVSGVDPVDASKATLLAPARVMTQEYQNLRCRTVDVLLPAPGRGSWSGLIDQLATELLSGATDVEVAYRGDRRWVQHFEPLRLETVNDSSLPLRDGGVYLITGGLGQVGMMLAGAIARRCKPKLALLGRSPLPDPEEWSAWVAAHGEDDPLSRRILGVRELRSLGAEVLVLQADVGRPAEMREAMNRITERFGAPNGLIHSAGIVGMSSGVLITECDPTTCEPQFQAKIRGLMVLDELTRDLELDFGLVLSSIASALGGLGFSAYAAGNLFLDAFVQEKSRLGRTRWLSVNSDYWLDTLPNIDPTLAGAVKRLFESAMTAKEGTEACLRILAQNVAPQVLLSTVALVPRIEQWVSHGAGAGEDSLDLLDVGDHQSQARPRLHTPYVEPRDQTERCIAEIWARGLGFETVGIDDGFFELGGHSLLGTQIIARLREEFQVDVPIRVLFENPTVAGLAAQVVLARNATTEPAIPRLKEFQDEIRVDSLSDAEVDALLRREIEGGAEGP